jgi:hypothetical protein
MARGNFGLVSSNRTLDLKSQEDALRTLAELTRRASVDPLVRNTALKIIRECASRDDSCELDAIYNAVKYGDREIPALLNGFKYVADPRYADYFSSPVDSLKNAARGAGGGDCDDHTALVCALGAAVGWKVGARAWGPKDSGGFSHVYPVFAYPKRPRPVQINGQNFGAFDKVMGMDTTVDSAEVGWEPPKGEVLTAWLD